MSSSSSVVLTTVLKLIDKYDLYGQVAYPKHHKQVEVPDIYRLAAKTKVTISKIQLCTHQILIVIQMTRHITASNEKKFKIECYIAISLLDQKMPYFELSKGMLTICL